MQKDQCERRFSGIQNLIVWRIQYNDKMQKIDCPSFFQKLASKIERDLSFKEFHQNNCKKGVFRLIKSTFSEMVELLKSFESKLSPDFTRDLGWTLQRGGKAFGYYQCKLFTWMSVWLIHRHNITYNQIFTAPLTTIEKIFNNKDPLLLRYEFFLVISLLKKQSRRWTVKENRTVQALINANNTEKENQAVNWKLISFRLFEKHFLRTPHQCRERWINHLDPGITKRKWTPSEDINMLQLYKEYGPRWSLIAKIVTHRNQHMIKNRFNALQRNWLRKNQESSQMFSVDRLIEEVGEMLQKDESLAKIEMKQRRRRKSSRRRHSKKKKEILISVSQPSPANHNEVQAANIVESLRQLVPQKNLNLSPGDQFLQHLGHFDTRLSFILNCIPQESRQQYVEHVCYQGQKFNESDYEWLDNLMEEKNGQWIQLQNM